MYIGIGARTKALAIYEDLILYTAHDGYLVGTGRPHRRGSVGNHGPRLQDKHHAHLRPHRLRWKGPRGSVLPRVANRLLRFGARRPDGKGIVEVLHHGRAGRAGRRLLGEGALGKKARLALGIAGFLRPRAQAGLLGNRQSHSLHAAETPWQRRRHVAVRARRCLQQLYSGTRYRHRQTGMGITSICRATTGTRITPTKEFSSERLSIRTPARSSGSIPRITRGEQRDVSVSVAEAGGLWVLDRATGEFLWAMPFPYDGPEFNISHIDVETGKTYINWDLVFQKDGDRRLICSFNTKGYWPMTYHPGNNALYVPFHDACLDMTANMSRESGFGPRFGLPRPGLRSQCVRRDRQDKHGDRPDPADLLGPDSRQRGHAGHGRRPDFLGRFESKVPGVRCRQRRHPLGKRFSGGPFR